MVEEIPAYTPSGEGEHLFVFVEKRGVSTMRAAERLAEMAGCAPRDVGYAGLKDRHATTRQWFSLPVGGGELTPLDPLGDDLVVLEAARHGNKLKLGHLRGNRFEIDLPCAEGAVEDVRSNLTELARAGVPNYFGAQRFGSEGRNLEKGLAILRGNPARAKRRLRKPLLRLLLSSVQSEVFNRVLAARIESIDRVESGDIAFLHANGACFLVDDALEARPRCAKFEISPTGPLPGPKTMTAAGEQAALEARVLEQLEIEPEQFRAFPSNHGERRPLRTRLTKPSVEHDGARLRIGFELDRGSFATTVLGELFEEAPWIEAVERPEPTG